MRRLTHLEYDNAVRDLLKDTSHPAREFASDTQIGLFNNSVSVQTVPALLAEDYLDAADQLARKADVASVTGCKDLAAASAGACMKTFIGRFGLRAYRRPLSDAEVARLLGVYDTTRTAADADTGARAVIAAVLASPWFLYRPEFGRGDELLPKARAASGFELASRLASLLWASQPDDALLDAAQSGKLETRADVEREARRMLDDAKARPAIANFYDQWLGLERLETVTKDPHVYPEYGSAMRDAMLEETRRFVSHVIWEDGAQLSRLLSAPYTFVNQTLAPLYDVPKPSAADSYVRVELDPSQRAGVLTQASILTAYARPDQSSPIKRGEWLRTRILCQDLPPPPVDVPELPDIPEGTSNRERFAQHTAAQACSNCHSLIDGLGFGLERYDAIGRFRSEDLGQPVDDTGEITSTRDIDGAFRGGRELADRLAASEQVRDCIPTQWLRFAAGRHEGADDACSLRDLKQAFADSGSNLKELMIALTQTDAFMHYRPAE
jgi:hypothetical protein